jgi:hypothetical protein
MAMRDLSVGQMLQVSKGWLEAEAKTLGSIEQVSGWLRGLRVAHQNLQKQDATRGAAAGGLAKVVAEQEGADGTHDRLLRGVWHVLTGLEMLAPELKVSSGAFATLQAQLFPDGLSMSMASYPDEAAQADLAPKRLSEDSEALLEVALGTRSLGDLVNAWLAAAKLIGKLEAQRNALVGASEESKAVNVNLRDARNGWMKVVNLIQSNLEGLDEKELDPSVRTRLLATLRRYEERAAKGVTTVDEAPAAPAPPPVGTDS